MTLENERQGVVICSFCNATSVVDRRNEGEPELKLERAAAVSGTSLWADA